MTDNGAAIRLQARIDKRDLWGIEADLRQVLQERDDAVRRAERAERVEAEADRLRDAWQQAWAERNEARGTVAAVRELAAKWAGEPTTIERYLANEILKLVTPFKEPAPDLNAGAPDSRKQAQT